MEESESSNGPGLIMLGKTFNSRYQLEQILCKSEQGSLYLATEISSGEMLAIKLFPEGVDFRDDGGLRYLRMMRLLEKIEHPNLLIPLKTGYAEGTAYQVLPYYPSQPLDKAIEEALFSIEDGVRLLRMTAQGLAKLHKSGICHLNIKPSNLLVSRTEDDLEVVLTDPARPLLADTDFPHGGISAAPYRSPEEIPGLEMEPDYRSDLYALGMLFFQVFTGTPPFKGITAKQILQHHLLEFPPDISESIPDFPPRLAGILMKLTAKKAYQRYQSLLGLLGDLEDWDKPVSRPVGAIDQPVKFPAESPLVGREAAQEAGLSAYARTSTGRGSFIVLAGEAGVGKRSLFENILPQMEAGEGLVLRTELPEQEWCSPFHLPLSLLEDLQRRWGSLSLTRRQYLAGRLTSTLGKNSGILTAIFPPLSEILPVAEPLPPLPLERERMRVLKTLEAAFSALADARHPLVLWIGHLEWIDDDSVSWLTHLLHQLPDKSILVMAGYTAGRGNPTSAVQHWLHHSAQIPGLNWLELPPLDESSFKFLTAHRLGIPVESDIDLLDSALINKLTAWIRSIWGGNPWAHHCVLNILLEGKKLRRIEASRDGEPPDWDCDWQGVEGLELPENPENLIGIRLENLSEDVRNVLFCASVFPGLFSLADLSSLLEHLPVEILLEHVETAIAKGLFRRISGGLTFTNRIIREYCQGQLPEKRKIQFHRLMGALLESQSESPPLLHYHNTARHFRLGDDTPRLITHGLKAAEEAANNQALHGALRWYRELLPHLGNDPRLPEILVAMGGCYILLGEPVPALDVVSQAKFFDLPESLNFQIQRLSGLAEAQQGEYKQALELFEQALSSLGETLPGTQMGAILSRLASGARRRYVEIRTAAGGSAPSPLDENERKVVDLLDQLAQVLAFVEPERAALADEKLLQFSASRQPAPPTIRALIRLGEAHGNPDDSYLEEASNLANHYGYLYEKAEIYTSMGRTRFNLFDIRRAKDAFFLACEGFKEVGDPLGEIEALRWVFEVERLQGPGATIFERALHLDGLSRLVESQEESNWAAACLSYSQGITGKIPVEEATATLKELSKKAQEEGLTVACRYFSFLGADLNIGTNRIGEAQDCLETASKEDAGGGDFWSCLVDSAMAEVHLLLVDSIPEDRDWHISQARDFTKSVKLAEKSFPRLAVETTRLEAMIFLVTGKAEAALELARNGEKHLDLQGARIALARLFLRIGEGLKNSGKSSWRNWAEKAQTLFETAGTPPFAFTARSLLAEGAATPLTFISAPQEEALTAPVGDSSFMASLLAQLETLLSQDQSTPESLHRTVLRSLLGACGAEYGLLFFPDAKGQLQPGEKISTIGGMGEINRWLVDTVWSEGKGEVLERFQIPIEQGESGKAAAQSAICVPLGVTSRALGVAYFGAEADKRNFDKADLNRINHLARQAGGFLAVAAKLETNTAVQNRMANENRDWERLSDWSGRAGIAGTTEEIIASLLEEAGQPLGFQGAVIYWMEDDQSRLTLGGSFHKNDDSPDLSSFNTISIGEGENSAAKACLEKKSIPFSPTVETNFSAQEKALYSSLQAISGFWLPILSGAKCMGTIIIYSNELPSVEVTEGSLNLEKALRLITPVLFKNRSMDSLIREKNELLEKQESMVETTSQLTRYMPEYLRNTLGGGEGISEVGKESWTPIAFGQIFDLVQLARLGKTETLSELRAYYKLINDGLLMHQGTLERIMGHQWIAKYDRGPDNSLWGIMTLYQMLLTFQEDRTAFGSPMLRTGLGIHLGGVIEGIIETEQKIEPVLIGEAVQVASRLAGMCRTFRTGILISEEVVEALEDTSPFDLRSLGMFRIGPGERRVGVFELFSIRDPEIKELMRSLNNDWKTALRHYQLGNWKEGMKLFKAYLKKLPQDRPARHYLRFCREREAKLEAGRS